MTDDGQAQNSLHANNSTCVGLMGWGERDRGPDLPRFRAQSDKTLSDLLSACYAF